MFITRFFALLLPAVFAFRAAVQPVKGIEILFVFRTDAEADDFLEIERRISVVLSVFADEPHFDELPFPPDDKAVDLIQRFEIRSPSYTSICF